MILACPYVLSSHHASHVAYLIEDMNFFQVST